MKSIIDNRMHFGFGTFLTFLYAMYGTYIASLYILLGDKAGARSHYFFAFLIISLLIGFSNFGKLLLIKTITVGTNSIILLLFMYMIFKLIIDYSPENIFSLETIYGEMGTNFIVGFIAFSAIESRVPIISKITRKIENPEGIRVLAITGTFIFIALMFYFLTKFLNISIFNILDIKVISNDYYQLFGDYIAIAFCCLISLQIFYFKRIIYSKKRIFIFALIILIQAWMSFLCLQVITSNKSVPLIILVSVFAIYLCNQKDLSIGRGQIIKNALFLFLMLSIIWILFSQLIQIMDVTQLRIFDYGESSVPLAGSSLRGRWQVIREQGMDQIFLAPLFGDLSITNYMHSSLLSVQTHLGLLGSLLLWSFLVTKLFNIYRNVGNEGIKAIALPLVFVSIISSFFTWGPLWFLIGALYANQVPKLAVIPMNITEKNNNNIKYFRKDIG